MSIEWKLCVGKFTNLIWCLFGIGTWFLVHLVIDQWIKQTICVRYFTGLSLVAFSDFPINKADTMCFIIFWVDYGYIWYWSSDWSRNYVLDILMSWLWVNLELNQWLDQTLRVCYFTWMILVIFSIGPVIKADTMC